MNLKKVERCLCLAGPLHSKYAAAIPYIVVGFLLVHTSPVRAQLADSAWPDYGGGYANQHRSPYRGPSSRPQLLWEFDLAIVQPGQFNRGYHQPILLPDGTVVLNTADTSNDEIVALNPDGTLRWVVNDSSLGPWLAADTQGQIYTIRHTRSFVRTERLRAVSFVGTSLWQANLPQGHSSTQNGPAVGHDGNVYAAGDHGQIRAVTSDGTAAWTSSESGYYVNPAVADDGTIIVGGFRLTALTPMGSVLWQRPARTTFGTSASFLSPAIGDDGTIYAGQINVPNLVALRPDGTEIWSRVDLGGAPAIGINGDIYVVPESGILHALNPVDGSTRWTYPTGKTDYYNSEGVTSDARGNIYVSNEQGILRSFTADGQLRWQWDFAPAQSGFIGISAPVIDANGVLYVVGGNTAKVFALVLIPEPSSSLILICGLMACLALPIRFSR